MLPGEGLFYKTAKIAGAWTFTSNGPRCVFFDDFHCYEIEEGERFLPLLEIR